MRMGCGMRPSCPGLAFRSRMTGFTVQDALSPAARAAKRTRLVPIEAGDDPGQVRPFFIDRRKENNPFEAARRNLDWEAIRGACNRGQKQVLSLLAEGYSQNEIASALKRTPGQSARNRRPGKSDRKEHLWHGRWGKRRAAERRLAEQRHSARLCGKLPHRKHLHQGLALLGHLA